MRQLEAAGLPLSMHGIVTLADLRAAAPESRPAPAAVAPR
jgi:hypothetical protein